MKLFSIHRFHLLVLAAVLAGSATALPASADEPAAEQQPQQSYVGDPYPLSTDPVTGETLGENPVDYVHNGRDLRFDNKKNLETFKADPQTYLDKVDARLIDMQKPFYPLTTCPVSGGKIDGMGAPTDVIVGNRLVRLCCGNCEAQVRDDPEAVIAKLDAAVIQQQQADYPLDTCVVSNEPLSDMGEPVDFVIANRLVRLCCPNCVASVKDHPAKYLAKLDKAETPGKQDDHRDHDHE